MAKESDTRKGQIHKGPVTAPLKSVPGYKPVSSIPAKFETILYTGAREKKGFSVESRRFGDTDNDNPGPGSYNSTPTPLHESKVESIGKKGYGPMASGARRFENRVYYTGPSPGDYRRQQALEDRSFSRASTSAAFQDKSTAPRVPIERDLPHLGPGAYDSTGVTRTGNRVDYLSRPGASSAFKSSGGHELILAGNLEAPASTSYELGDPWEKNKLLSGKGGSRGGTSSFGAGGGRGAASVGSMATNLDTLLFGAPVAAGKPDAGPGPGAYELQDFASIRSKLSRQGQRPSPAFQFPEHSQRPGAKQVLVSAGDRVAHDYLSPSHPPLGSRSPPKGVSSPFRSRSAGHAESMEQRSYAAAANAPGPAYYQPNTALKKSHHRNAKA
ncbi:hypothetical protein CHLRE_12g486700v5 [Chlamydomonas reinhardtii]|uniref:Uncharacterized protein n=1 Tax=Chlamydomonas reinhardtii TaxID=3055 RepID=A0A2K3D2E6_CHLRE|nr:uncharacterized protein CHLRE_12g486700v5 [Chlamydomonas reinhardtii]XP_042918086.1 uncharacterized protein CHLRE_12g486700v5 [Chlamydomonas reinhardtii]PNW74694.1 hypothetical protein CHLRE_12g486700v5 [Chlamydomonas reinhardtii]PNW74695.1 hypothetical protein CHLRE_12g486700v5 [Chlamydomonas reinhardtii]